MLDVLFDHPQTDWDFTDGAWLGARAGFVRLDGSRKPVYEALKQRIRRGWTSVFSRAINPGDCRYAIDSVGCLWYNRSKQFVAGGINMLDLKSHRLIMNEKSTPSCHASTVLPLEDGRVLIAWFGGSGEGRTDVGIWLAEKNEKGFGEPHVVAQSLLPHWNPVLYRFEDGRIVLFYKMGMKIPHWRTMFIESFDGGQTFSEPRELVPGDVSGGRGPVRNKPIRLKSGRVLAPASTELGLWRCFVDISDDDGYTWRKSGMIEIPGLEEYERKLLAWQRMAEQSNVPVERPAELKHGRGIIQPTLWESETGVHALMRSGEGFIYRSDSTDGGETWRAPYPTNMPNNNSGIDMTQMPDGTLLLVYNPVQESWGMRTPISIAQSKDDGETWTKLCNLQTEQGEFSYPAIVSAGNRVYITYTYKRENIAYWEFEWNK